MNKFGKFLKDVFIVKFWVKLISLLLAVYAIVLLNI